MAIVIIVAQVAVNLRTDYKLHPVIHEPAGVSDNMGLDTVSLACLPLGFPGML